MTTYDDTIFDDIDLDDYPEDEGIEWYCNHDVPNGCHDCAWLRAESDMLDAMTHDERRAYFASQDARDEARGFALDF